MTRPVYGYVYGLVLAGWDDVRPPYIGKTVGSTEAAITRRVWGKSASAHTSPQSIARDPWKARILPGRAGWVRLEAVYSCGDPVEDDRALRRAESDWIDRRNPVHNDVRPVRPGGRPPRARKPAARPAPRARARRRKRPNGAAWAILALTILFAALIARVAVYLPWPAAPWVVSPALGFTAAWSVFWRARRAARKLLR